MNAAKELKIFMMMVRINASTLKETILNGVYVVMIIMLLKISEKNC